MSQEAIVSRVKRFFTEEERTTSVGGKDVEERWAKCAEVEHACERVRRALSYEAMREEASEAVYWSQLQSALEALRSTLERCALQAAELAAETRAHLKGSPAMDDRDLLASRLPWLDELERRLETLQDVVVDRDVIDRVAQRLGRQWREVAKVCRLSWMLNRVVLGGLGLAVLALVGFWTGMGRAVAEFQGGIGDSWDAFVGSLGYHGRLIAAIAACGATAALVFYKLTATARIRREVGYIVDYVGRYLSYTELHDIDGSVQEARALPGRRDKIAHDGLTADLVRFAAGFLLVVLTFAIPLALAAIREPVFVALEGERDCVEGLPLPSTGDELVMLARGGSEGDFETMSIPLRRVLMTTDEAKGCLGDPALRQPRSPDLAALASELAQLVERQPGALDQETLQVGRDLLAIVRGMAERPVDPPTRVSVSLPERATAALDSIAAHAASIDQQAAALKGLPSQVEQLGSGIADLHSDLGGLGSAVSRPASALVSAAFADRCMQRELLLRGLWTRTVGPLTDKGRDEFVRTILARCEREASERVSGLEGIRAESLPGGNHPAVVGPVIDPGG